MPMRKLAILGVSTAALMLLVAGIGRRWGTRRVGGDPICCLTCGQQCACDCGGAVDADVGSPR